jgi:sterol desaturase/sphingolipid hydroxylase (fatty acid hydroxylase superfamily)
VTVGDIEKFRGPFLFGMLALLLYLETRRPLRRASHPKILRVITNLSIAAVSGFIMRAFFVPVVLSVAHLTEENRWGLLQMGSALPALVYYGLAFLFLDYTLYLWHLSSHRIAFLWQFHHVHHVDLDLDVSTASRFHFGELMISSGYRCLQIVLFGIDPLTVVLYETLVTLSAQFHHSNLALPLRVERVLVRFVVTPRMHAVHHSIVQKETDSNFSAILTVWDRFHRTLRLNVAQSEITIGTAAYRNWGETTLFTSLLLPFKRARPWKLPDGTLPERETRVHPTALAP